MRKHYSNKRNTIRQEKTHSYNLIWRCTTTRFENTHSFHMESDG